MTAQLLPSLQGEGLGVGSLTTSKGEAGNLKLFPPKRRYRPHPRPLPLKGGERLRATRHQDKRTQAQNKPYGNDGAATPLLRRGRGRLNSPRLISFILLMVLCACVPACQRVFFSLCATQHPLQKNGKNSEHAVTP